MARRLLTKQEIRQAIWDHIPVVAEPEFEYEDFEYEYVGMIYPEMLEAFFEGQGDSGFFDLGTYL